MNDLDPLSPNSADSQRRLMVALALAMALTFAYTYFFAPKGPPPEAGVADAGQVVAGTDAGTAAPTPGTGTAGTPPPVGTPGPEVAGADTAPPPPVRTLDFERLWAHYVFSTQGAGFTSAPLQGPKMREQGQLSIAEGYKLLFGGDVPPPPQMNLAQPVAGQPLPLSVSIAGPSPLPADARYAVAETGTPENGNGVTFTTRQGPWEVTKTLQWPKEGFEMLYTLQVKNTSAQPATGELQLHYNRAIDPNNEQAPSFFGGVGNLSYASCRVGDEEHKLAPEQSLPDADESRGPVHYFGIDQQYFLSALYPLDGPLPGRCDFVATDTARAVTAGFPLTAAPGQTVTYRFGGYFGPKDDELLAAVPGPAVREASGATAAYNPELTRTIDYGMWAVIAKLLVSIMKFFHGLVGNWGVAIILLTVLVKTILLPLTHRSMVSMEAMKKLQPRIEELRKKYADDRERQNMEMMKVYQEAKVNPLGGCLPMLIQMPVWIALFTALRNSYDLYQEPFFGPVWRDLTYKDPTYILPLALGISMIITQRLQPQMGDPTQAKIMTWFVPILFTLTLLNYPAGLALYIFTNNILSIAQQYGLRKWLERREGGGGGGLPATATAGGKRK